MKKDAESYAEEDRKRRESVEVRNQADSLAYQAEKTVTESGDKIPTDIRSEIETAIKDVRDALTADAEADTIAGARDRLQTALQKAGSALYEQPGENGAAPDGETPESEGEAPAEEGTVEGEYREV